MQNFGKSVTTVSERLIDWYNYFQELGKTLKSLFPHSFLFYDHSGQ